MKEIQSYNNILAVMRVVKKIPNTLPAIAAIEKLCKAPPGLFGAMQSMGLFTGNSQFIYSD